MKKKRKVIEYAIGGNTGRLGNSIPNPAEILAQNSINAVNAESEGANDPFLQSLGAVGSFLMGNASGINTNFSNKALGGRTGRKIEVEGKEVIETPLGDVLEVVGPSHKQGGVDAIVPENSYVFPDQIKIDDMSLADRKKKRVKLEGGIEKSLSTNMADAILKNTLKRVKNNNEQEELNDKKVQTLVEFSASLKKKDSFAIGGDVGDKKKKDFDLGLTTGDATGFLGNFISTFGPLLNTLENRGGDTPNINPFKDFGKNALETIDESKGFADDIKNKALLDLNESRAGSFKRNAGSARSVNTLRALNLATDSQVNKGKRAVNADFSKTMLGILSEQGQLENAQDGVVMSGEQQRDLADRQDRDAFFTAKGTDITTLGAGIQETGKDLNAIKQNNISKNLVGQISKYGFTFDKDGNLIPPESGIVETEETGVETEEDDFQSLENMLSKITEGISLGSTSGAASNLIFPKKVKNR